MCENIHINTTRIEEKESVKILFSIFIPTWNNLTFLK